MSTNPTLEDLLHESTWLEWRSLVPAQALRQSDMVTTAQTRQEFVDGCRILRLDERRRGGDGLIGPSPIQLAIADTLNAGHKFNGVMEPRRTTKTTSIQAVALGRCQHREDFQVGWTITKRDGGTKVSERFRKDILVHIERRWPDKRSRPFTVVTSNGGEHIRWPNGSFFSMYAPQNEGFTSGAYDLAWVDEAQDADPDIVESLLTSIPPTLDGRFSYIDDGTQMGAQMIASGTAPDWQDGNLLWQMLHHPRGGVLMHGIDPATDPEELEAWEADEEHPRARVRELVELSHPGVGFNTPLSDVADNFETMRPPKVFHREYLGLPGTEGSNVALLSQAKWTESAQALAKAGKVAPSRFALVAFVHPDAAAASVAAAWYGPKGVTKVGLLHHQKGVEGFAKRLQALARKHRRAITYDSASAATEVELRQLRESKPAPAEKPVMSKDIARAAIHFSKLLNEGKLEHFDQPELNAAVEIAVKRNFATGTGWAFGRPKKDGKLVEDADITPLEAVALAAYKLADERGKRESAQIDFF
ncbi:hypothetical protein [Microbacterium sp. MTN4-26]|uniref:hypothetical protein n=1 Tax=unclassified Microbacterium TaxID=2609290 RepID=UPI0036F43AB7